MFEHGNRQLKDADRGVKSNFAKALASMIQLNRLFSGSGSRSHLKALGQNSASMPKTVDWNRTIGQAVAEGKNKRVLMYTRFINTKTRHPLTREGQLI